jgi:hypothetical protein
MKHLLNSRTRALRTIMTPARFPAHAARIGKIATWGHRTPSAARADAWPVRYWCASTAPAEAADSGAIRRADGRGHSRPLEPRRSVRRFGSSSGKRRPDPHGHGSLRPSFSTSSVSMPTMRSPRLTRDSLEGTPGGACWSAQKDASASRSQYISCLPNRRRATGS